MSGSTMFSHDFDNFFTTATGTESNNNKNYDGNNDHEDGNYDEGKDDHEDGNYDDDNDYNDDWDTDDDDHDESIE